MNKKIIGFTLLSILTIGLGVCISFAVILKAIIVFISLF